MKILFVLNNYYCPGNGLTASARRTVHYLQQAGHDVRVLSARNFQAESPQPDYPLDEQYIPIFDPLVKAHGYLFAKCDKKVIKEAVDWADVVHMEEAFIIEMATAKYCLEVGKPITGTYHMHPENICCSLHMGSWKWVNEFLLRFARDHVFNYCSHIQCPTQNVYDRLTSMGFKSKLHVISNGIIPDACIRKPVAEDDPSRPFLVTMIGRLAVEKDQPTLIKAMRYSKYANRIQLYFAGQGPEAKAFKEMADALYDEGILKYRPIFAFHTRDELRELAAKSDLYVHCATVEVEGLSALEALQQGVVPIIAQGRLTATAQFALDQRSLFLEKDYRELARKIDYWLDNPQERHRMSAEYVASTDKYDIHKSIDALVEMFQEAIDDAKNK